MAFQCLTFVEHQLVKHQSRTANLAPLDLTGSLMYARAVAFVRAGDLFSLQPFALALYLTPTSAGRLQEGL